MPKCRPYNLTVPCLWLCLRGTKRKSVQHFISHRLISVSLESCDFERRQRQSSWQRSHDENEELFDCWTFKSAENPVTKHLALHGRHLKRSFLSGAELKSDSAPAECTGPKREKGTTYSGSIKYCFWLLLHTKQGHFFVLFTYICSRNMLRWRHTFTKKITGNIQKKTIVS